MGKRKYRAGTVKQLRAWGRQGGKLGGHQGGKVGGAVRSERKTRAARRNAKLGGLPLSRRKCSYCTRRLGITNRSGICRQCQRRPSGKGLAQERRK